FVSETIDLHWADLLSRGGCEFSTSSIKGRVDGRRSANSAFGCRAGLLAGSARIFDVGRVSGTESRFGGSPRWRPVVGAVLDCGRRGVCGLAARSKIAGSCRGKRKARLAVGFALANLSRAHPSLSFVF